MKWSLSLGLSASITHGLSVPLTVDQSAAVLLMMVPTNT